MHRVIVAGCGYAGLSACLEMAHRFSGRGDGYGYDVVVVNDAETHTFLTDLHSLAVGVEDEEDVQLELAPLLRPPLRLVVDRVDRVDPQARRVHLAGGGGLSYDVLVLATGSVPQDYGIQGVRTHALFLTDVASAQRIRQRLDALAQRGYGDVVLVGGGLTGVELAAEVADTYGERLAVHLLEAGDRILPGIDERLSRASHRLLVDKGIDVRTQVAIADVTADAVHAEGGVRIPYDLLLWTAGVKASPVVARSGLLTDRLGRGVTDAYLRARGWEDVYLAGDCAAFATPHGYLPPTAQAAEQMGRAAAANALRWLQGQPLEPFVPRIRGFFASLGEWEGVGQVGQEDFFGLPAIVVKRLIEAHHAWEAGGAHALFRRLVRTGTRLLWGSAMGRERLKRRLEESPAPQMAPASVAGAEHGAPPSSEARPS